MKEQAWAKAGIVLGELNGDWSLTHGPTDSSIAFRYRDIDGGLDHAMSFDELASSFLDATDIAERLKVRARR